MYVLRLAIVLVAVLVTLPMENSPCSLKLVSGWRHDGILPILFSINFHAAKRVLSD